MCDSNFVNNYDNYFANVAYQATEQTHHDNAGGDESYLAAPMHYYNPLPADLPPPTQQQQQNMLMLPPHLMQPQHSQLPFAQQRTTTTAPQQQSAPSFAASPMHRTGQPLKIVSSVRNATAAAPNRIPGNSASPIYGNIPFVQIHTTDARPQKSNFGNVFRRSATNQEIKSEPIKSESSELAKESANATPTPPVQTERSISDDGDLAPTTTQIATNDFGREAAAEPTNKVTSELEVASATKPRVPMLSIHKCNQCAFFSLSIAGLEAHTTVVHPRGLFCGGPNSGLRIPCPGCDNVFYAYNSLETHLREDHLTFSEDCVKLMEVVKKSYNNSMENTNVEPTVNSTAEKKTPKVRIRNVAYLRDRRPPNILQDSQIDESLYQLTACVNDSALNERQEPDLISMLTDQNVEEFGKNISKLNISDAPPPSSTQKISLVNTDALREPARVRQEYETMSSLSSFLSNCSDVNVHIANDIEDTPNNQSIGLTANENNLNHFDERHPKIYIRNVGSLQEQGNLNVAPNINSNAMNYNFMTPALPQVGNGNYLANGESFGSNVQVYDAGLSQMALGNISDQYIFDSGANGSYMAALDRCEGFPTFVNQQSDITYTMYESQLNDDLQHPIHPSNTPIITEPTPPPPPTSHTGSQSQTYVHPTSLDQLDQKPFIRNVNIIRPPEARGTLHLRTVDELNLMNKNEVQSLIAPNLDNTLNSINNSHAQYNKESFTVMTDSSKLFESESEAALEELSPWPDLDCIITDVISPLNCSFSLPSEDSPKDLLHLETPHMPVNSVCDTEELTRGQAFNKPLPPPPAQEKQQYQQPLSAQIKEPEEILDPHSVANKKQAGASPGTSKETNLSTARKKRARTAVVGSRLPPKSAHKTVSMPSPKGALPIKKTVEAPQIIPISSLSSLLNYSNVPPLVASSSTAKSPSVCFVTPSITITPISTPKPKEPATSASSTLPVPPLAYPLKQLVSQKAANTERRALVSTESLTVTSHNVSSAKQKSCGEPQLLVSPELRSLLTSPKLPLSTASTTVRDAGTTSTTSCSQKATGNPNASASSQLSITVTQKSSAKRKVNAPADLQPNALPPERRTHFSVCGLNIANLIPPPKRRTTSADSVAAARAQMSISPSNRPLVSSTHATATSQQPTSPVTSIVTVAPPEQLKPSASAPASQPTSVARRSFTDLESDGVTAKHMAAGARAQMSISSSNRPFISSPHATATAQQPTSTVTSIVNVAPPEQVKPSASDPVNQATSVARRYFTSPENDVVTAQHPAHAGTAATGITPPKQSSPVPAQGHFDETAASSAVKKPSTASAIFQRGAIVVIPQESLLTKPKKASETMATQLLPVKPKEGNFIQVKEISKLTENMSRSNAPITRKRAPARRPTAPTPTTAVSAQTAAVSGNIPTTTRTPTEKHATIPATSRPSVPVSRTRMPIDTTAPSAESDSKNDKAVAAQTSPPELRLRTFSTMAAATAQPQLSPAEGATAAAAPPPATPQLALRIQTRNVLVANSHRLGFKAQVSGSAIGKTAQKTAPAKKAAAPAKARIYIASNLLKSTAASTRKQAAECQPETAAQSDQTSPVDAVVPLRGGRSVRGRIFGKVRKMAAARLTRYVAKKRAQANQRKFKCTVKKCTFRFNERETLEYHKKCHTSTTERNAKQCPECKTSNFKKWNTLHTHLWHIHKVDMELYSCGRCKYKTPNYSRLVKIHAPGHLDKRPFKCRECKTRYFKTAKQLWAHSSWHREMRKRSDTVESHPCARCGAVFSRLKTLREHACNLPDETVQCPQCERKLSSRAALLLHIRIHEERSRYECPTCGYKCSDHNAMRRHKETHDKKNVYQCRFCDYNSVQSTGYQRHIKAKHAENAAEVLFLCKISECAFSSINEKLLSRHMLSKHQKGARSAKTPQPPGEAQTTSREQTHCTDSSFSTAAVDGDVTIPATTPTMSTATAAQDKPKRGRPRKNIENPGNVQASPRISQRGRKLPSKKLSQDD